MRVGSAGKENNAMSRFYEGVVEDDQIDEIDEVEETEEVEEVEGVEDDDSATDDEAFELDPEFQAWLRDKDPHAVRKTFDKFTNEWEQVKSKEKELAPLEELRQNLQSDPGLIRAIEAYYDRRDSGEGVDPDEKIQMLEAKLQGFQTKLATERELERLHAENEKYGISDFDDVELLEFARENRIGSLEVAYKAFRHDEIVAAEKRKLQDAIKKNAKLKVETKPKSGSTSGKVTLADLEAMGDDEFLRAIKPT